MLTDVKPNHQTDSLYTETEVSENSHLQIEPNDNRQLIEKNASEDSATLDFDYLTNFGGDKALIEEASKVSKSFVSFLRRTFKDLITLGNSLWGVCNKCVDTLGKTEGKAQFNRWLDAEFGNSQNLARTTMSLSQWYNSLRPAMQRLVAKNVKNWSVAAIKKLTSLTDELVAVLVKSGKQTAKSIERAIATSLASELTPLPAEEDRPVTNSDWSSLRKNFNLRPKHIKVLKHKAKNLASLSAETSPVVKVSHVNEAIAQCKEAPELLTQPPAKKAKKKKTDRSTPAESPLQDNSDEAITELIASAIASDMEKQLAANSQTSALLQQTMAEKDTAIAAQKEQINNAIAGKQEKATRAHQEQMESLHQALGVPVEGMYTQEQLNEAIARDREKRKDYVYTEEDVKEKVAGACKQLYTDEDVQEEIEFELRRQRIALKEEGLYTEKQVSAKIAEAIASLKETTDTAAAEKIASLQQSLTEKDRKIASLEEQQAAAEAEEIASLQKELAEKDQAIASMSEQTAAAVAQARAEEREKTASAMASQIASLQQQLAELQQTLAEKDRAIASLEEQNANSVASGSPLMEKEKEAAVAQARAEEREKMTRVMDFKFESLQKELAEKNQALASSLEDTAAAVAEARADEQAVAWHDIEMLQEEIKGLKAQNHSLQTTKEQLATAHRQVEELQSQLTDSENKYKEKVRWLEYDFNSVTKTNQDKGKEIQQLEEANRSMNQENRSLKDELAGYKNIEKKIQLNYHKIDQAEKLQVENAKLRESLQSARQNLQGQINQSVSLASDVTKLNNVRDQIICLQWNLAKQGIPGCKKESYVSPQDGQEYQGVKGIVKLIQDLVSNNNFNQKTT